MPTKNDEDRATKATQGPGNQSHTPEEANEEEDHEGGQTGSTQAAEQDSPGTRSIGRKIGDRRGGAQPKMGNWGTCRNGESERAL